MKRTFDSGRWLALALAGLGCAAPWTAARLTQPVSMSPMADATLSVEAGRVLVTDYTIRNGMDDGALLGVELGITNAGAEAYTLNGASITCWFELSADRSGETLSLTPGGGGEGQVPSDLSVDDMKLGSLTIPPGQTRTYWVMFRGYKFPGSEVPRKITVSLPDQRNRRVQLVIADPARGELRWEMEPLGYDIMYGIQGTTLYGSALQASGGGGHFALVWRAGPLFLDFSLTGRTLVETQGVLSTTTGGFMSLGYGGHLTAPLLGWGTDLNPRRLGPYTGIEGQLMFGIGKTRTEATSTYGVFSLEGGVELDIGNLATAATPFPISFKGRALPRWTVRVGYTHWFFLGGNSGGYTTTVRFTF